MVSSLAEMLRSDPTQPLVTMYDDGTGERVELSATTFDNWVCKVSNLFTMEWELGPGERVAVLMPTHWQSMVSILAAWTSGLVVALDRETVVSASVVGPPSWIGERSEEHILACSLRPFADAEPMALPPGWLDFDNEVPPQPDALLEAAAGGPDDPAVVGPSGLATNAELLLRGRTAADTLGLTPGGRLVTDLNPADPAGLDVALLAPLATGSSVVLLVDVPPARRSVLAAQEQVTCSRWSDGSDG